MPRQAVIAAMLVLAACVEQPLAVSDAESAVVGGTAVQSGEWPDAVAVLGSSGTCSGTLIAPDIVLTAGHCANIDPQQVIADTIDYSQDAGIRVRVAKV